MSSRGCISLSVCAVSALALGGCSTLGGNVKGSFACRAPEGTCAPTSAIDQQAIGLTDPASAGQTPRSPFQQGGRTLQIVVAARRDDAGREHEARVVHVVLSEGPAKDWRAPLGNTDVLRALGASLANPSAESASPHASPTDSTAHLPDQLFIPSQPGPALPGASAPATGASDRPASPDRVPHPAQAEGDER